MPNPHRRRLSRRQHQQAANTNMKPIPKVGDKIKVVGNSNDHNYTVGSLFTVTHVDASDNTLQARDTTGFSGNWIRWRDCERAISVGWDFVKTVLPTEVVSFLSAFNGITSIELQTDIKDAILKKLPNLHELIMDEHSRQKAETAEWGGPNF